MMERYEKPQENILTGILGALVGALLGAVAWVLVGMLGYVTAIVGFLIAFLSSKGYDLGKGRQGTIKLVVVLLCTVLAVVVGTAGSYVWILHDAWMTETSSLTEFERSLYPSEAEFLQIALQNEEVQAEFFQNLATGLLFGALGSFGLILGLRNKKQTQQEVVPVTQFTGDAPSAGNPSSNDTDHQDNSAAM